jgi:hypothetical protein
MRRRATSERARSSWALAAAAAIAVLAVAVPPGASGEVSLVGFRDHQTDLPDALPLNATVAVPFNVTSGGSVYVKLLATPWNAVNNGTANGSVAPDHSVGLSGWWAAFTLADGNGSPLSRDAAGTAIDPFLGAYSDTTPTPLVALAPGNYELLLTAHVPKTAAPNSTNRVVIAIAFRAGSDSGSTNGGFLDQSVGYTESLVLGSAAAGAVDSGGTEAGQGSGGGPGSSSPGSSAAHPGGGSPVQVGTSDPGVSSFVSEAQTYLASADFREISTFAAIVALVASAIALTVASYAFSALRREVAALRHEPAMAASDPGPASGATAPSNGHTGPSTHATSPPPVPSARSPAAALSSGDLRPPRPRRRVRRGRGPREPL